MTDKEIKQVEELISEDLSNLDDMALSLLESSDTLKDIISRKVDYLFGYNQPPTISEDLDYSSLSFVELVTERLRYVDDTLKEIKDLIGRI